MRFQNAQSIITFEYDRGDKYVQFRLTKDDFSCNLKYVFVALEREAFPALHDVTILAKLFDNYYDEVIAALSDKSFKERYYSAAKRELRGTGLFPPNWRPK